jgi:hypothetical protein
MLDVVLKAYQDKLASHMEEIKAVDIEGGEILRNTKGKQTLKRKLPQYYDKQQQLELVLATQELLEFDNHNLVHIDFDEEEKCWTYTKDIDIWKDVTCMKLLHEGILLDIVDLEESKKARKRIINYHWQDQRLYFKGLFVLKLEERMALIIQMHEDFGHFGEQRTLVEICRRYFWHNRMEDVKIVVKMCQ